MMQNAVPNTHTLIARFIGNSIKIDKNGCRGRNMALGIDFLFKYTHNSTERDQKIGESKYTQK